LPFAINFRGVFRVKHPQISELHISHLKKSLPYTRPRLLTYCAPRKLIHGRVWAVALLKNIKTKTKKTIKKVTASVYVDPRDVSTAHRTRTNFVRVGDLPNVITHAKFDINCYKIVPLAKGWSFHVSALLRRTPLTRLSPAGLPVMALNMNKQKMENAVLKK